MVNQNLQWNFFFMKGIYVLTMELGMTTDRLFGGLDIPKYHNDGEA
jgi:hypothetical protein